MNHLDSRAKEKGLPVKDATKCCNVIRDGQDFGIKGTLERLIVAAKPRAQTILVLERVSGAQFDCTEEKEYRRPGYVTVTQRITQLPFTNRSLVTDFDAPTRNADYQQEQ
jgi:hypothetical protein